MNSVGWCGVSPGTPTLLSGASSSLGGPGDDNLDDFEGFNKIFGGTGNDYMSANGTMIDGGPGSDWITVGSYDGSFPENIRNRSIREELA